jgi:hypothetical protein
MQLDDAQFELCNSLSVFVTNEDWDGGSSLEANNEISNMLTPVIFIGVLSALMLFIMRAFDFVHP